MHIMDERCAGVDVHKKTVVAWVLTPEGQGGWRPAIRTVGTMPGDVLAGADGLLACGCTPVAIASTGDDGKPGFNSLAGIGAVLVGKAQHAQAVPGRKTEVQDAAWRAELWPQGLWHARFIPPVAPRERRDLTRYRRTGIQARGTLIHRVQQLLAEAHIKLAAVASDLLGVSGRAMLAALVAGPTAPHALAELANGRLRRTRDLLAQALDGRVKPPQRLGLTALWCHIDRRADTMARFEAPIHAICGPFDAAVERLDTMPGVARRTADTSVAAIGPDMTRFPSADPRASWAGVAPGHQDSAGKRTSGKARKGNRCLRTTRVPAAHAAARTQGPDLSAPYRRLAARRGHKRAIVAGAHAMLVMADDMIQRQAPDRDAGADFFDRLQPEDTARRLLKRLERLGYHVTRQSASTDAMP